MNRGYPDVAPGPAAPDPVAAPERAGVPIPLYKPRATFVLLGLIALVFVLQLITDTLNISPGVADYGVQVNALVARGAYWRLLTAMFIHFGIPHFIFNGWALMSLGQEVESFYGSPRFVVIYFLAGLFGGMISYLLAPVNWLLVPSAGASGAIFGIVGADLAFFLANRRAMGRLGQRQLVNLGILVAINLAIGFSPGSGINNYAHLGGLAGGLLLGLGLVPRYTLRWEGMTPQLVDRRSVKLQMLVVALVVVLLLAGLYLGDQRWAPYLPLIR